MPLPDLRPRTALIAFVCFTGAGAALRLHHLGTESLWLDEAFSITVGRTSLANIVFETSRDVHPPIYYFLLHYWMRLAGDTEVSGRLLSVVFSLATMAATYGLSARLFDRLTGVVAAALLAVSPFQVEFAQEARMYAMVALLATLSTYTLVRLSERWQAGGFVAYVATTSLLTYTHIYAMFVLAAQATTLAWFFAADRARFRRMFRPWLVAMVLVVLLFTPWMSILAAQTEHVQSGFWIPQQPWAAVLLPLWTYAGSTPAAILLAAAAIIGAFAARRPTADRPAAPTPLAILLPWICAPIVLPFVLSRIGSPIFLPKYTIAASVPWAMLAARGVTAVPMGRRVLATALVAGVVALSWSTLQVYYDWPRKDDWRGAAAKVGAAAQPGDVVYLYRGFNQIPFDYYLRRRDLIERPFALDTTNAMADMLAPPLSRETGGHDRVWFVTLNYEPARPAIEDAFRRSFTETAHVEAHDIDIYLFERAR